MERSLSLMPDREEDTEFLSRLLKLQRGLQSKIANLFGCSQQVISQQIDSNSPTHAWTAQYSRFQFCLDYSDLERGDELWNKISEDRRRWREAIERERREGSDLDTLTGNLGTEYVEFVQSRLCGKPDEEQLRECEDIVRVARQTADQIKRSMRELKAV